MNTNEPISQRELGEFMGSVLSKLNSIDEKIANIACEHKEAMKYWHPKIEACEQSQIKIMALCGFLGSFAGLAATILVKILWR